jgi:hypothetical protein
MIKMPEPNYKKYLVDKPAYEVIPNMEVAGRIHAMTLLSSNLIPGVKTYVETGWILSMPDPNPHIKEHVHDYDEIVIHLGMNPDDPEDLGAEIEFYLGGKKLILNKTSTVYVPKGVKHGPLIWKRVDRPHLEMTIMLGAGTLAEADPGGYKAIIKGGV